MDHPSTAWVTIDATFHTIGDTLTCVYSTDSGQIGNVTTVEARNGLSVLLPVPAAGFVIYR